MPPHRNEAGPLSGGPYGFGTVAQSIVPYRGAVKGESIMKASRRPEPIRARIEALYERYPLDKYIWIQPRMDTASPLPEHFDLAVYVRAITTDSKANYIYPLKAHWDRDARMQVADPEGGFALAKPALMGLAADAGIKWPLEGNGRIDDGSNPDVIEWRATGTILTLSGMSPVSATKRIDLSIARLQDEMRMRAKPPNEIYRGGKAARWSDLSDDERDEYIRTKVQENDLQRRANLSEMAESKAQLRVVRSFLGIPSKFDISTLETKQFATLRIIFAPNPTNPQERRAVLDGMMRMFLPAFPGAGEAQARPIELGSVEAPLQLGAPRRPAVEVAGEIDAVEDDENDPFGFDEIPPPASDPAPPPEPTKAPLDPEFLKAVGVQKRELCNLLGAEKGAAVYYEVLGGLGYEHANAVAEPTHKKLIYRGLESRIKTIKAEAAAKQPEIPAEKKPEKPLELTEPGNSYETFLAARRRSLGRMSMERIAEELDDMLEYYPAKADPEKIMPRIKQPKDKDDLIEVMMLLTRWNIDGTAQIRERHNSTRGGER